MKFLDATRYPEKAHPKREGFERIIHLYEIDLLEWEDNDNPDSFPDEKRIKEKVAPYDGKRITLNIEAWKFPYWPNYDEVGIQLSIDKYHDVLRWAKEQCPNADIGLANGIPNPHHPMRHRGQELENWNRCIKQILPMFEYADSMYPGVYAVYEEFATWAQVAQMRIYVASQTEKPCYPYMWHRAGGSIYNNELIRREYLRKMLDFLTDCFMVDGITWWSAYGEGRDKLAGFSSSDSWWQELKRHMK